MEKMYGVPRESLIKLIQEQDNKCAICGFSVSFDDHSNGRATACIDHDHSTGRVRGILCNHCNRGLGMFRDSTEALTKAANYVANKSRGIPKEWIK